MILRLTQKLGSRLKAGSLKPMPMDEAPIADWTGHLFFFNRTPYIILCNTATLYSAVLFGNGITNDSIVIPRVLTTLRAAMEADGLEFAYERFIVPRTGLIYFASGFSRSVTGSMNELVAYATRVRPRKLLLVHGDAPALQWMAQTLSAALPETEVIIPLPGERLRLDT